MAKAKIIRQSGTIPYLCEGEEWKTVLVTASKNNTFWLFPKGHLEENLSSSEAAAQEAYEEAGLRGIVDKKSIGTYSFSKLGKEYRVKLYPMKVKKVLKKWPESKRRNREILTFAEAVERLEVPEMKELAVKMLSRLSKGKNQPPSDDQPESA